MESALRRAAPDDLRLIETFRWEPAAGFVRLAGASGADGARRGGAGGRASTAAAVDRVLAAVGGGEPLRVRLTLGLDGAVGGDARRRSARARRSGRVAVAGGAAARRTTRGCG